MSNQISTEAVTEIANKLVEKDIEIKRLRIAIHTIEILYAKKNMHLGRPRWDEDCIACLCYFALNNGAYGVDAPLERFEEAHKKAESKS